MIGKLRGHPQVGYDTARQRDVCQAEIEVDGAVAIPLLAYDELAQRLGAARPEACVSIAGRLFTRQWKTGDQKTHHKLVVEVDTLEILQERWPCETRLKT